MCNRALVLRLVAGLVVVMVDVFKLLICALLRRDAKVLTRSCVPTAYVQPPTRLASTRGLGAQLT